MNAATKLLLLRPRGVSLVNYLRRIAGYFGTPPMQELTGTTALFDNVALALGRRLNLLTYGDYTAGAGWSNSGGEVALHTAGNTATLQQDGILAAGRTYQAKVTVSGRTAGSITITEGGAAISANGQATRTITSTGANFIITPTTDFDGSLDLAVVLVQQTGILDSGAGLGLLDGTYSGVTLAQPGEGNITYMPSFDAVTSYLTILSAELNSALPVGGGSILIPFEITAASWKDGANRYLIQIEADASNRMTIRKSNIDDSLFFRVEAGGTDRNGTYNVGALGYSTAIMTWNSTAVKFYVGNTLLQTLGAVGTWVGNIDTAVVGALNTIPTSVLNGKLAYAPVIGTSAWDATTIAQINAAFGVA